MEKIKLVLKILKQICPYSNIEPATELIDSGILTSINLFDLIVQLEMELDIRISEELILAENFSTAEIITETVLKEVES